MKSEIEQIEKKISRSHLIVFDHFCQINKRNLTDPRCTAAPNEVLKANNGHISDSTIDNAVDIECLY